MCAFPLQLNLHEVYNGGLGSWSLLNMALAHLADEASTTPRGAPPTLAARNPGAALLAFLRRFSGVGAFDYGRHAIALRLGGLVDQAALGPAFAKHTAFLVLEDPLTGGGGRVGRTCAGLGCGGATLSCPS